MSAEPTDLPGEDTERSWGERIAAVGDAWSALIETRLAILREELGAKAILLAKGVVAAAIGMGLAIGALLLLGALLVAVLAHWFGSVGFGILGAFVLYAGGTAAAAAFAVRALRRVKPFEFPISSEELRRDWSAVRESWAVEKDEKTGEGEPGSLGAPAAPGDKPAPVEDLEERYRAGAE